MMENEKKNPVPLSLKERQEALRGDYPRFYENWSLDEMRRTRSLFREGQRFGEIAAALGRTVKAVKMKLMGMDEICCPMGRDGEPWTYDEEERLLRLLSQGYDIGELARIIGRRKEDVRRQIVELSYSE